MERFSDRELWVLRAVIAEKIAASKSQSLMQVLASVRRTLDKELTKRGAHPGAPRVTNVQEEALNNGSTNVK